MFQGINPIAQIIISIGILLALSVIAVIIFRRGIKLGYKKGYISLGRGECAPGIIQVRRQDLEIIFDLFVNSVSEISEITGKQSLSKKMKYAESKLPILKKRMDEIYYKLLSEKISDDNFLTENEDLEYYTLSIQNMIYTDNGFMSIKSLLRNYLRDKDYNREAGEYNRYIKEFTSLVFENCRRFFNFYYKSEVAGTVGRRQRLVSSKELYDSFQTKSLMDIAEDIFRDIFDNAKCVDLEIEKEKQKIIDKRKIRLSDLLEIED